MLQIGVKSLKNYVRINVSRRKLFFELYHSLREHDGYTNGCAGFEVGRQKPSPLQV